MWSRKAQDNYLAQLGVRLELDVDRSPYRGRVVTLDGDLVDEVDGLLLEEIYANAERVARDR